MKSLVIRSAAGNAGTTVIEYGLVIALIGLACITAWMHFSASLNAPAASVNTTRPVETTGGSQPRAAPCATHAGDCALRRSRDYGARFAVCAALIQAIRTRAK